MRRMVFLLVIVLLAACNNEDPVLSAPTSVLCPLIPAEDSACQLVSPDADYDRSQYEMLPALRLSADQVALYRDYGGSTILVDNPGIHPYPARDVVLYPLDIITYKTERETDNPTKCPGAPVYCDTPVDNIVFGDGTDGVIDLAITFQVVFNSDNNGTLYQIGGVVEIISLLTQEVRNYRALMSDISPDIAVSRQGHEAIRQVIEEGLADWSYNHLVDFQDVQIRSINVVDETFNALRATQQAAENAARITANERELAATQIVYDRQATATQSAFEMRSNARIEEDQRSVAATQIVLDRAATATQSAFSLQLQLDAAALNRQIMAEGLAFEREQSIEDARAYAEMVSLLCAGIPAEDCVDLIWIYTFGSEFRPVRGPDGALGVLAPTAIPTPTAMP